MARTLSSQGGVDRAQAEGDNVARSEWLGWLGRAGLVARGVIYAIVGVLAVQVALGDGGDTTTQQGALRTIAQQPFGKVLLILTAVGLLGYALWRLVRAAVGHGREATDDTKDRLAGLASGVAYSILFVSALRILLDSGSSSGDGGSGQAQQTTSGVLGWPGGPWIVGIAGVIVVGVGLDQVRKGVQKKFCEDAKVGQMSHEVRRTYELVGLAGHVARGIVFGLIGVFLVRAALQSDADEVVSLDGALAKLGQTTLGPWLLGLVAAGLVLFAAYSLMDARYRKV